MHAFLKDLIARIVKLGKGRSPAPGLRRVRPAVEAMEDRLVPSTSPVAVGLSSPVVRLHGWPVRAAVVDYFHQGPAHAAGVTIPVEQRGLVGPNETPVAERGIIINYIPVEQRGGRVQSHKALGVKPHRARGAGHHHHPGQVRGSYSPDGDRPGFLTLAGAHGLNFTRGETHGFNPQPDPPGVTAPPKVSR
jgi:hypothetical protein